MKEGLARQKEIKQQADVLLDEASTWAQRRLCLQKMEELFVKFGAFDVNNEALRVPGALLAGGTAIAPTWAGMCLFDIARTRQFVRGLKQAIEDKLPQHNNEPVQVLDAGCGPYALLSLLCALYFSPGQVQFTIVDIFTANINSARTLIKELQMEEYFAVMVCADATTYNWPNEKPLCIVVTETMNRALWKEPQVAISLHLSPQLSNNGILIPESIEVSLKCSDQKNNSREQGQNAAATEVLNTLPCAFSIHPLLKLDKHSTHAGISKRPIATVSLPADYSSGQYQLQLCTEIIVYKEIKLADNQSAVTLPKPIKADAQLAKEGALTLSFYYNMDEEPGLCFTQA